MKTVKVQPLTQESFSKYGSFENLYQPQTMGVGVGTDNENSSPLDFWQLFNIKAAWLA